MGETSRAFVPKDCELVEMILFQSRGINRIPRCNNVQWNLQIEMACESDFRILKESL
jgi:hypothetical protein